VKYSNDSFSIGTRLELTRWYFIPLPEPLLESTTAGPSTGPMKLQGKPEKVIWVILSPEV